MPRACAAPSNERLAWWVVNPGAVFLLVLVAVLLLCSCVLAAWLYTHDGRVFLYGSLQPFDGNLMPPDSVVLYASCAWPLVSYGTDLPPPYLDPATCLDGKCCPAGYLRNTTTSTARTETYCSSIEHACRTQSTAQRCVRLLTEDSSTVSTAAFQGLLVRLNVKSATWSWLLLLLLAPLALVLLWSSIRMWQQVVRQAKWGELRLLAGATPDRDTIDDLSPVSSDPVVVNCDLYWVAFALIGVLAAAMVLAASLAALCFSTPNLRTSRWLLHCLSHSNAAIVAPLASWYSLLAVTAISTVVVVCILWLVHGMLLIQLRFRSLYLLLVSLLAVVFLSYCVSVILCAVFGILHRTT